RVFEKVREYLCGFEGMEVFDIGCGNGKMVFEALKEFSSVRYFGIDRSKAMIEETKQRCPYSDSEFMATDIYSFATERMFDRIFLCHVLHLLDKKEAILTFVKKHLKKQGRCVITLHSKDDAPKKRDWIQWFKNQYQKTYQNNHGNVTIETWPSLFGTKFEPVVAECVRGNIQLSEASPYLAYLETERHRFHPDPTEEEWNAFLLYVQNEIESSIKEQGFFDEEQRYGVLVLENAS
ncbi:TPA: hypothetical protein DD617_05290, partial [Candidatus Uhrbacteria bacterium]|nr:hypothetical protein [Candidatus Uhrbacteria bacterium]